MAASDGQRLLKWWPVIGAALIALTASASANSRQDRDITSLQKDVGSIDRRTGEVEMVVPEIRERLARLEQSAQNTEATVSRIDRKLDAFAPD